MTPASNGQPQVAPYTIVVGVTGHRFLHRLDELVPRIDAVLDFIEAAWPGAALTVVSSLAEGSDRLVVGRVLRTLPRAAGRAAAAAGGCLHPGFSHTRLPPGVYGIAGPGE